MQFASYKRHSASKSVNNSPRPATLTPNSESAQKPFINGQVLTSDSNQALHQCPSVTSLNTLPSTDTFTLLDWDLRTQASGQSSIISPQFLSLNYWVSSTLQHGHDPVPFQDNGQLVSPFDTPMESDDDILHKYFDFKNAELTHPSLHTNGAYSVQNIVQTTIDARTVMAKYGALEPSLNNQQAASGLHDSWKADHLRSLRDTWRPITSDKPHSQMVYMNILGNMQGSGSVGVQDQEKTLPSKEIPNGGKKRRGFMEKTAQKIKNICGEFFTTSADKLTDHTKTPKKGKKKCKKQKTVKLFNCDIDSCIVTCGRKRDLKRHRMTHTGEYPYFCDICGKRFQRMDKRNSHKNKNKCNKD